MAFRDLIPWSKDQELARREEQNPFLALHREMNRLFDDAFSGFGFGPRGSSLMEGRFAWPRVELAETNNGAQGHRRTAGTGREGRSGRTGQWRPAHPRRKESG